MSIETRIESIIQPSIESMGYALVQVRMMESNSGRTLQIMAERHDEREMTVDDCADISRRVSALLEVEDPINGAYRLEISSPGIDRPLIKPADYQKHKGYEIKAETQMPVNGRKRFKGVLNKADAKGIEIEIDGQSYRLEYAQITHAKLVLTDELIRQALKKQQQA